jgi:hypothetical protein
MRGDPMKKPNYGRASLAVIPAKAGTHSLRNSAVSQWIPAFAGMTNVGAAFEVIHG